ncbi:MAG TPA: GNAT family N-acetyltransferase [Candidatus Nanoarchaeia archaeon]|nr:GNAT family N-acetyltransferase [Candidatus Nanoarchaeia archaeon]
MLLQTKEIPTKAKKLTLSEKGKEIGRVWIHYIHNDLRAQPYALIEDLFVEEKFRGKGMGSKLIKTAIAQAKKEGCYKVLATSRHTRPQVHEFYKKLGFQEWGKEFRMNFN